ncbi:peptidoglycan recognition family protein [Nitrospirillum sp. BR 11752]|uniref:peptidoglycan recognition protein family protein n=1 Tax=Nitrospirillum sp. BR 11752 TaxID=3104293 RepID=UPI002EB0557B|nr:peptidoglycan recognition family protein [Nitrospirillum sp. BR 11752]
MLMQLDADGWVVDSKVTKSPFPNLKHGTMAAIHGIIVHQTGSPSRDATFNSYRGASPNGAHFLIDKNGDVYQTASVTWKLWHVGKLRPRCLLQHSCPATEVKLITGWRVAQVHEIERQKAFPDRFPMNDDSIGIEIVSDNIIEPKGTTFEPVTPEQNAALDWMIAGLKALLRFPAIEIYRHPDVSFKNIHEAETATWH